MNPKAVIQLFQPELGSIARRYGTDVAMSIVTQLDRAMDAKARLAPPGSTLTVDVDWNSIEAQLAGQTAAATRAEEKAQAQDAEMIHLTAEGLAKIVAAARAEPDKVIDISYDHHGADGHPIRMEQRSRR